MATTFTLPRHLFTGESRQQLIDGLEEVTGLSCPLTLHYALGDEDRRWDELVNRAVQRVLPEVAALLDAAAAEWERAPIEIEWRRVAKAVPA
ncbi:MAG: hypothetical protein H0W81_04880 [Chloroflexi bacterium]|nr:hypothetical protein [Chloroflexota bacterium]